MAQRNALDVLRQDHRKVKDLFEAFEESVDLTEQKEAVDTVIKELRRHAQLEEQIFYLVVRESRAVEHLLNEVEEEHQDVEAVIKDLQDMEPEDPLFSDKFIELEDGVLHHIQKDESELFPQAEGSSLDLNGMGQAMLDLRQRLQKEETPVKKPNGHSRAAPTSRRSYA